MADWAAGTRVYYANVGSGVYTEIGDVESVDAGKIKRASIKTTNVNPTDKFHTKRKGMKDNDAMKAVIFYAKTLHNTLLSMFNDDNLYDWKFELSDGSTIVRTGFMSEFEVVPKADVEDVYKNNIAWEFTGPPVFTPAS